METSVAPTVKVKPGERTILDAIHAAPGAATRSGSGAEALDAIMDRAASAAQEAARSTADMRCRVGRANRLCNRVLGPSYQGHARLDQNPALAPVVN
jgi:DAK2 domain